MEISLNDTDRFIYAKEIRPFLPARIFDVHTHLLKNAYYPHLAELGFPEEVTNTDVACLRQWWERLFPDSELSGLVMAFPGKNSDIDAINRDVAEDIRDKNLPFSILTRPGDSAAKLESEIQRLKPAGLKPYMCYAQIPDVSQASITDMITEEQIALADKYRLCITLHVAKARGMADEDNLKDITRLVGEYPGCNFILAHCGRCFITPNMEDTLKKLPVAENLWLDTSAVCDTGVFLHLFNKYDLSRVLFGTDLVCATGLRGTYVRMGMSWHPCTPETLQMMGKLQDSSTFIVYESLCKLFCASQFSKLSDQDIQNIFYENAAKLFKLN